MTNQTELPPGMLTFEQLEPLVGQTFDLPIGDEHFALTLTEAKLLQHYNPEVHLRPNKLAQYKSVALVMASAQRLGITKLGVVGNEQFVK